MIEERLDRIIPRFVYVALFPSGAHARQPA